jgi:hypothetical protein
VIRGIVSGGLDRERRKLFIWAFRFLETNNVRLGSFEPFKQSILTFPQRIDVPRNNFHQSVILGEAKNLTVGA